MNKGIENARILVVDDEEVNLILLERLLTRAGFDNLQGTSDPRQVLYHFESFEPDLILIDLHMPHLDGITLIEQLNERIPTEHYLPIVVLTADLSPEAEKKALSSGAKDFLNKPFKAAQITLRLRNLLETRRLHLELQANNQLLEERVKDRTIELEAARLDILERLALAAEYRDYETGRHTQRVGELSALLAQKLGLPPKEVELIRRAAPLHDVGKIGIPDEILLKPGKLSLGEFEVMKTHVNIGVKLLAEGHSDIMQMAELISLSHHERFDGSGYPRGLKGDDIPLIGQIVAVTDVFDTLISKRPYKEAWPLEKAVAEVQRQSGKWFSPRIVVAFFRVLAEQEHIIAQRSPAETVNWSKAS